MAACSGASHATDDGDDTTTGGDTTPSDGGKLSPRDAGSSSSSPVPNAMADEWYASGSRLKLQYYEADDGAKQFVGWFDSQRSENCTFSLHADGQIRCLPISTGLSAYSYYSDATCRTLLASRSASNAPAPAYAYSGNGTGCQLFSIAAPYTGSVYMALSTCTNVTASTSSDFFLLGDEIPGTSFVAVTLKTAQ